MLATLRTGMQATLRAGFPARRVFINALQSDWRRRPGMPYVELPPRLEVEAGPCSDTWAEQESGAADPCGFRRSGRLVGSAAPVARTTGKPRAARP